MQARSKKIKCVHIITKLELGGAQDNTLFTLEALKPDKYEKVLITGKGGMLDGDVKKSSEFEKYFVGSLKRKINPFYDIVSLIWIFVILVKIKPDIVHTHSSKAGIIGRWAAFFARVPMIIHTFHGFGFNKFQNSLFRYSLILSERITALITTALVAVSEDNRKVALENGIGYRGDFEVIHSGIRRNGHREGSFDRRDVLRERDWDLKELFPDKSGDLFVTNISCLKPQKKPSDFVKLAHILIKEMGHDSVKFLLIGDGELRDEVKEAISCYNLDKYVCALGWRRDAQYILRKSDVFVLNSLWEGLPRALVEAMYLEKPCAAYNVDGINDIISDGENGFLANVLDVGELARKVDILLKDPQKRSEMGKKARVSLDESFFIENMVEIIDRFYDRFSR